MMEPIFRAQWLHITCIRRARLQSVGRLLCYDPSVTLADRETALKELGRSGRNSRDIQPWNYLRACVHQWNTEVVYQTISNDDPTVENLERDIAEILNSLPCSQLQTSQDICAICHQTMAEGEMVCNLPCGHFYHVGCIDAWLRIRTTCPLDNRQIFGKNWFEGLTWNHVDGMTCRELFLVWCQTCFKKNKNTLRRCFRIWRILLKTIMLQVCLENPLDLERHLWHWLKCSCNGDIQWAHSKSRIL